jgi:hypothetical protein
VPPSGGRDDSSGKKIPTRGGGARQRGKRVRADAPTRVVAARDAHGARPSGAAAGRSAGELVAHRALEQTVKQNPYPARGEQRSAAAGASCDGRGGRFACARAPAAGVQNGARSAQRSVAATRSAAAARCSILRARSRARRDGARRCASADAERSAGRGRRQLQFRRCGERRACAPKRTSSCAAAATTNDDE